MKVARWVREGTTVMVVYVHILTSPTNPLRSIGCLQIDACMVYVRNVKKCLGWRRSGLCPKRTALRRRNLAKTRQTIGKPEPKPLAYQMPTLRALPGVRSSITDDPWNTDGQVRS